MPEQPPALPAATPSPGHAVEVHTPAPLPAEATVPIITGVAHYNAVQVRVGGGTYTLRAPYPGATTATNVVRAPRPAAERQPTFTSHEHAVGVVAVDGVLVKPMGVGNRVPPVGVLIEEAAAKEGVDWREEDTATLTHRAIAAFLNDSGDAPMMRATATEFALRTGGGPATALPVQAIASVQVPEATAASADMPLAAINNFPEQTLPTAGHPPTPVAGSNIETPSGIRWYSATDGSLPVRNTAAEPTYNPPETGDPYLRRTYEGYADALRSGDPEHQAWLWDGYRAYREAWASAGYEMQAPPFPDPAQPGAGGAAEAEAAALPHRTRGQAPDGQPDYSGYVSVMADIETPASVSGTFPAGAVASNLPPGSQPVDPTAPADAPDPARPPEAEPTGYPVEVVLTPPLTAALAASQTKFEQIDTLPTHQARIAMAQVELDKFLALCREAGIESGQSKDVDDVIRQLGGRIESDKAMLQAQQGGASQAARLAATTAGVPLGVEGGEGIVHRRMWGTEEGQDALARILAGLRTP